MKDDPFDPENLQLPPDLMLDGGTKPHTAAKKSKRLRPLTEPFIQLTETGARGFAVFGGAAALVWFNILYRAWKTKETTVELPNGSLADMGVSRWTKYRALERLEQTGWIKADRPPGKTIRVTLLKLGCVGGVREPHR